jgi:hypothetical protein
VMRLMVVPKHKKEGDDPDSDDDDQGGNCNWHRNWNVFLEMFFF